jgi:precorrin-6Y C5,15-methyltransferase (decarboxylating)
VTIHVVGLGIEPGNLSEDASYIIDNAQVLVGGKRQLAEFEDHPARKHTVAAPLEKTLDRISEEYANNAEIVVLADGDPLFYGIGSGIVERFGTDDVRIYPGVTTLQSAAARLKVPWHDVTTVSLHGRDDYGPLYSALIRSEWVAVYTDDKNVPSRVAQNVLDKGGDTHAVWVLENLGVEGERHQRLTLAEAAASSFSRLNIVLLERIRDPAVRLGLGTPDHFFAACDAPVTKGPIRSVALATLRMTADDVLWDLGAGCGVLGIEASSLCRKGRVYSVEKNADRVAMIRENVKRSGAYLVEVVHGTMPRCLSDLPDPNRIFLGGGMARDGKLLAEACERLKPGGRFVANLVLMDNLLKAKQTFKSMGWNYFITLVQAAESSDLAWDMHMKGLNPVFIIGADKPE